MSISMKYPDGTIHIIEPSRLLHVVNDVYVCDYNDVTQAEAMHNSFAFTQTILIRRNNRFIKQPLHNYEDGWDELYRYFEEVGEEEDIEILPDLIACVPPVNIDTFIEGYLHLSREDVANNAQRIENGNYSYAYAPDVKNPPNERYRYQQREQVNTRTAILIFFNEADNKYYWDGRCTRVIEGAPDSLGTLNGEHIRGIGKFDYIIKKVNIKTESSKYLYSKEDEYFYLKEEDAKRFGFLGNLEIVEYNYEYEGDGKNTIHTDRLVPIPEFDVLYCSDEYAKQELEQHKENIINTKLKGKSTGTRNIPVYMDSDGNKYIDNYYVRHYNIRFTEPTVSIYSYNSGVGKNITREFDKYNQYIRASIERNVDSKVKFIKMPLLVKKDHDYYEEAIVNPQNEELKPIVKR